MVKLTIDLPNEYSFMKNVPPIYWILAAKRISEEREEKRRKIVHIKGIAEKSKATDSDAKELTFEIDKAVEKHYAQYR